MFEVDWLNGPRNLLVIVDKVSVDGPQVRRVLVPGEVQPHVKDESVYLCILFDSEEGHLCISLQYNYISTVSRVYRTNNQEISVLGCCGTVLRSSSTYSVVLCCPRTTCDGEAPKARPSSSFSKGRRASPGFGHLLLAGWARFAFALACRGRTSFRCS